MRWRTPARCDHSRIVGNKVSNPLADNWSQTSCSQWLCVQSANHCGSSTVKASPPLVGFHSLNRTEPIVASSAGAATALGRTPCVDGSRVVRTIREENHTQVTSDRSTRGEQRPEAV